jgi:hypothetical protein
MDLEVRDDSFDIIVVVVVRRSKDYHRIITWWLTPSLSTPTMGTIKSNINTEDVDDDKLDGNTKMRRNHKLEHVHVKSHYVRNVDQCMPATARKVIISTHRTVETRTWPRTQFLYGIVWSILAGKYCNWC